MQEQDTPATDAPETRKRPYERPEIIDYGSIRDMTRGVGSKAPFDMMSGTRRTTF